MHTTMSERGLRLRLEAGQSLPIHVCWRIEDGYLRATSWSNQRDIFTLGIWGPGEVIVPQLLAQKPIELRTLSSAQVQEWSPDPAHHHACVQGHIQQIATLLELTRIRPAEARLFSLLVWLGERFGTSTAQGRSVPLDPLNLTHRQLAEMASVSRVTVTKALGHFRQLGWLQRTGELDVLSEAGVAAVRGLR
jgi:CRP-like cAMP-binding protein